MKPLISFLFLLLYCLGFSQNTNPNVGFIENRGQIVNQNGKPNTAVKYLLNTNGLNVQLRENGFSYDVYELEKTTTDQNKAEESYKTLYHRIDIDFVRCNSKARLVAEGKSADYDNYYNVNSNPDGILDVYKFQKVTYVDIYPNIDVVFFIPKDKSKPVEYNFIVKPKGKIADIQMKFSGASTDLMDNKIKMNVRFGEMEETLPLSWTDSDKKEIDICYKKISKNIYGFSSKANLSGKKIVIDPVPTRLWGTFYGDATNNNNSTFGDICTDSAGNIYMVGHTSSSNSSYATSGAHQTTIGNPTTITSDGIIVKFSPVGNRLWGTYYGGSENDKIYGCKIDTGGSLVISGSSYSANNISTGNSLTGFEDAFIVKFTANGVRTWGRYFGGDYDEEAFDIDIDSNNQIYIVGTTRSYTGISFNSTHQTLLNNLGSPANTSNDGFIAKFTDTGTLVWSTYVGGSSLDELRCIKVGTNYLVTGGNTMSNDLIATPGTFQQTFTNYYDGMFFKFSLTGTRLWGSFYGGDKIDKIRDINIDSTDNVYIVGETASTLGVASPGAFDTFNLNTETGFMAKFDSNCQRLWGTYIGAGAKLNSVHIKDNFIYVAGTGGPDTSIVTPCAYISGGFAEGYIGKFSTNGNLLWGSYTGGFDQYSLNRIAFEHNNIVIGGTTSNNDGIGNSSSYQPSILGSKNFYLVDFSEAVSCNITATPGSTYNPCPGNTIQFNVEPGYTYSWTGPNGFTSNLRNPAILNSSTLNNGTYTLIVSDNCNCQKTFNLPVSIQDNVKPVPDAVTLPAISGTCSVSVTTVPTATDNCSGAIQGTTIDPLNYAIPGIYTIHWQFDDNNGNIETQNQTVTLVSTSLPIANSTYHLCPSDIKTISDIPITGQNIKWYDAAGNLLVSTTVLQDGITYYATQTVNSCESQRIPVAVVVQQTIAPTGSNQSFCSTQNPTLSDIVVNGLGIKWYATATSTAALPSNTAVSDNTTYYASQTVNGCESPGRLPITTSLIYTLNGNNYAETICDNGNDGELLTLSNYNSFLITPVTGTIISYYDTFAHAENPFAPYLTYTPNLGLNVLYARIESSNGCHQVVELQLTLVQTPIIKIPDEVGLCDNQSLILTVDSGFDSYSWSTGSTSSSVVITQAGNYWVTVTQNHGSVICTSTKNFTVVLSNPPTISSIHVRDWTDNQNSITVNLDAASLGDYEYSIDGTNFQDSNVFIGLLNGTYTVTVRDKHDCGITTQEVYLLNYPKFFTPNGDGYNDNWYIRFSQFEPNFEVKIFDRYGKLLKKMGNAEFWDGTFNGKPMPSDDYWFNVIRDGGRIYKGHFAMKR